MRALHLSATPAHVARQLERVALVAGGGAPHAAALAIPAAVVAAATALPRLTELTVDARDADLAPDDSIDCELFVPRQRTLRRLSLRHVRLSHVEALGQLHLTRLDLRQVDQIDILMSEQLAPVLSNDNAAMLQTLLLDYRPVRGAQSVDKTIASSASHWFNVEMLGVMFHRLGTDACNAIGAHCTNLQSLYLSGCTIDGDMDGLTQLSSLRTLEMFGCLVADPAPQLARLARLTSVKSLMLFDNLAAPDLIALSPLENLVDLYSDSASLTMDAAQALEQLPSLRYLHLAGANSAGLKRVLGGSLGPKLRALDFRYEYNESAVDDEYIERLCQGAPNLYFVDFDGATRPTNASLLSLAQLEHLRHVNLRDAQNVSRVAFQRLAAFLANEVESTDEFNNGSNVSGPMDQLRQYRELLEKHMQQQCCTRGFPLDSWRACLDLAKRHFRRAKRGTLRVRHDRALLLDQLDVLSRAPAVVAACADFLGERAFARLAQQASSRQAANSATEGQTEFSAMLSELELEGLLPCGGLLDDDTQLFNVDDI